MGWLEGRLYNYALITIKNELLKSEWLILEFLFVHINKVVYYASMFSFYLEEMFGNDVFMEHCSMLYYKAICFDVLQYLTWWIIYAYHFQIIAI